LSGILNSINNGNIVGGTFTGGIVGRMNMLHFSTLLFCANAGKISGFPVHNDNYNNQSFIGGIVGFAVNNDFTVFFRGQTNIGHIDGGRYKYVGGIGGCIVNFPILDCMNSGMVDGGDITTIIGGIAGYISSRYGINAALNTNKVGPGSAFNFGALIGLNAGVTLSNCYYDNQMSGIGDTNTNAIGLPTAAMLGDNLGVYFTAFP